MTMKILVLDSGPLGKLAHPKAKLEISDWFEARILSGDRLIIPEICDYEVRRELLRAGLHESVSRLDSLKLSLEFLPIRAQSMLLAADLWAKVRNAGMPTAPDLALDGDVIVAAQTLDAFKSAIVVTDNPKHISRFVDAREYFDIG
jgi:predicted nucleic acid-binding protein